MNRRERLAWVLLVLVALCLRVWQLGARPPHHDESVHAYFTDTLLHQGEYHYDPTYHGPLLYYITAPVFAIFGESLVTLRLYPALAGVALVALPLALRRRIGPRAAWFAGSIIAISPSFLYYSRFGREDMGVALFTAAALVLFANVRRHGWRPIPWIGVAAALHACTKETFYVTLPLLAVAGCTVAVHGGLATSVRRALAWLRQHAVPVTTAVLWFLVVTITAYTVLFTHPADALFPVKAIRYWYEQHKIQRVGGPWFYHLPRLALYEVLPVFGGLVWVLRRLRRLREIEVFCASWGLASIAMYAYLGEKVPWLEVHQVLPFVPLAAMQLARTFGPHGRWWSRGLAGTAIAATLWSAVAVTYLHPTITTSDPHAELLVFVQTTPEEGLLADHGLALAKAQPENPEAAVAGEGTWPLSWQWRKLPVWWSLPTAAMRPPIVVCDPKDELPLATQLGSAYTERRIPLRGWWVETYRGITPLDVLRWFVTRRAWSPVGATDIAVYERAGTAPPVPGPGAPH